MNSKVKVKHPIAIKWKIPEAKLQEKRNSIDGYLDSAVFDIPGTDVQYYVAIFPNGNNDERRGESWIFFYLIYEEKKEIKAEITISIQSTTVEIEHVFKEFYGWGGDICTTDELFDLDKRFIVDAELIIKVKGFLMIEKDAPVELRKLSENGNTLGMTLWNQESKDFAIVVDEKEITAHKIILSARSPVFQAMFQPHTKEAQEGKVVIPDFTFKIVEIAIKLCYDTRLVEDIPIDDMILLLQFFDKYDIQSLTMDLEKLMILEVNEFTVCRFANCSLLSNASKLKEKCSQFLEECIRERKPVNDFNILNKDFAFDLLENSTFQISL